MAKKPDRKQLTEQIKALEAKRNELIAQEIEAKTRLQIHEQARQNMHDVCFDVSRTISQIDDERTRTRAEKLRDELVEVLATTMAAREYRSIQSRRKLQSESAVGFTKVNLIRDVKGAECDA